MENKHLNWRRSRNGLPTYIHNLQKCRSKSRKREAPTYTKEELKVWFWAQPNADKLYNNWVASNYERTLMPSIDRVDDSKGYSFDNIQLVTLDFNLKKKSSKHTKSVFQYDKERNLINTFSSVNDAYKTLNIPRRSMSRYLSNKTTHKTFIFSHYKLCCQT